MSVRRLPSGRWQAEVRIPGSTRRKTSTFDLRRDAVNWQGETRAALRRGEWRDPALGRILFDDWMVRWLAARQVEPETAVADVRRIDRHVLPRWHGMPLAAIGRLEVQAWITGLTRAGVGEPTVRRVYALFASCLKAAVAEDLLARTPCRDIELPDPEPRPVTWWTPAEMTLILARLDEPEATIARLMVWCGLRWEEAAALSVGQINWLRREITVTQVVTSSRRIKRYPKSTAGFRVVAILGPLGDHLEQVWRAASEAGGPDALLFPARDGRPRLNRTWGAYWRSRIRDGRRPGRRPSPVGVPYYTPHALRHTGASWLAQAGVPLADIARWLGHAPGSDATTVYAHLCPESSNKTVAAGFRARSVNVDETASAL